MSTCSSALAWRIPWTEESGGLQSMGSQRVGRGRATEHAPCGSRPTLVNIKCWSLFLAFKGLQKVTWSNCLPSCRYPHLRDEKAEAQCCGLNVCIPYPPYLLLLQLVCEIVTPSVVVFGAETFGK